MRIEDPHLAMGSMTVPALVTTLGLIILRWAVRGTKVEPMGARILAWVGRFLWVNTGRDRLVGDRPSPR